MACLDYQVGLQQAPRRCVRATCLAIQLQQQNCKAWVLSSPPQQHASTNHVSNNTNDVRCADTV